MVFNELLTPTKNIQFVFQEILFERYFTPTKIEESQTCYEIAAYRSKRLVVVL